MMSETAVERRLRVVVKDARMDAVMIDDEEIAAIDAGREAIALLRAYKAGQTHLAEWYPVVCALLARCEGEQ